MEYCKNNHPLDEKNLYIYPSGRRACRTCRKVWDNSYRLRHSENIAVRKLEWFERNKNKHSEYSKRYKENNPDAYRKAKKKYRQNNPDKEREWDHRKRALKRNQLGDWKASYEQVLFKNQNGLCFYCRCDISKGYHIEHMIPLSRGGMHDLKNIVLSCPDCNLRKGTQTAEEFIQGDNMTITYIPTSTIVYTSKTYRQCGGTPWDGSGRCSSCGAEVGTGGTCLALVEIAPILEEDIHYD